MPAPATAQASKAPAKSAGGVLPIPAAVTHAHTNGSGQAQTKSSAARLKVLIRRLPPGITHPEVQDVLGPEWATGRGKVDWVSFKPGKVSKDMSKPSRPARLYLQVSNSAHLDTLSEKVRSATFTDARNTASDPVLLGPPNLEFAPYQRAATGKRRNDARQGTIDQDPEFMEFLESLISPISKLAPTEASDDKTASKVTVTPLIQHLRDKKAAKEAAKQKKDKEKAPKQPSTNAKEAAEKKAEPETAASSAKEPASTASKKNSRTPKADKAVKAAPSKVIKKDNSATDSRPAPNTSIAQAAANVTPSAGSAQTAAMTPNTQAPARKADAVNPAAAAARMLQRDLGIRGGRGGSIGRRGGRPVQDATAASTTASTSTPQNVGNPTKPITASNVAAQRTTTPAIQSITAKPQNNNPILRPTLAQASTTPIPAPSNPTTKPSPHAPPLSKLIPLPLSGHGFLKHANPSQGITEPLLEVALGAFGTIVKVEIDKRKGFAYVEYTEPVGLQKAIAASPIKVAQGSVQVLEKRDRVARGGLGAGGLPVQAQAGVGRGSTAGTMGRGLMAGQVPSGPAAYRAGRDGGSMRGRGNMPPIQAQKLGGMVAAAPTQAPVSIAASAPTAPAAATPSTAPTAPSGPAASSAITAVSSLPPAQPASTAQAPASNTQAPVSNTQAPGSSASAPPTLLAPDTTSAPPPATTPAS